MGTSTCISKVMDEKMKKKQDFFLLLNLRRFVTEVTFLVRESPITFELSKRHIGDDSKVFENHRKSRIQHCARSELRLHFEWPKVNQKCQNGQVGAFLKT